MSVIFWFRRDLRLEDNEALNAAIAHARGSLSARVIATYAFDLNAFEALEPIRSHSLVESLKALKESLDGALFIVSSRETDAVAKSLATHALESQANTVFATRAFDPAGIREQQQVHNQLAAINVKLVLVGSNYAVNPGSVTKSDGSAYKVYTPFSNAWMHIGWNRPFELPARDSFEFEQPTVLQSIIPAARGEVGFQIKAGEAFALRTWERFKARALYNYHELRDRADLSGTSHLSHALAHGEIHPRTLLAELADTEGHNVFRKEIAWREFYADVLWHNPQSAHDYLNSAYKKMRYDEGSPANERLQAWMQGQTGYPMVDAGMRQLLTEGWVHNRVRMIVASFLVKDLHLEWTAGADWFERNLSDFDVASNSHGWQWTAGCGTDASPYYRVFNPITQGYKFDPNGDYVRKYVPELRHIDGKEVHEPWLLIDGLINGYPAPIVDHSAERLESLARLEELKHQ